MAEYIEREAATELLKQRLYETALNSTGFNADAGDVYADAAERLEKTWINELPAADVRLVKRGEWQSWNQDKPPCKWYSCDYCGYHSLNKSNFCPNCGADMREES